MKNRERKKAEWELWKQKGKWKFIVAHGLAFGIITAPISHLVIWLIGQPIGVTLFQAFFSLNFLLRLLVSVFFGGPLYGLFMWHFYQWRYERK